MAFVTLHVGAGTFQPVRVDTIQITSCTREYAEVAQDVVRRGTGGESAR